MSLIAPFECCGRRFPRQSPATRRSAACVDATRTSIWEFYREGEEHRPDAEILGFFCMLHLTAEGARLMAADELDTSDPDPQFLIGAGERPSAIYYWAIIAEGLTISAGPMIIIAMGSNYADVPIYVRPTTEAGLKRVLKSDYKPLVAGRGGMGDVFTMPRYPHLEKLKAMLAPRLAAPARKAAPRISVKVASTPAEIEMSMRIRAVYMIEQGCPFEEEYDGNDYCGTTLIGFVDGEPAGTLRIRYFADFVKFERMTVLPRFRGRTTVAREIVKAAVAFCTRKGFRKGYGHAQLQALKFWQRLVSDRCRRTARLSSRITNMSRSKASSRRTSTPSPSTAIPT